jgi:hypothetical protein
MTAHEERVNLRAVISLKQIERILALAHHHGLDDETLCHFCRLQFSAALPALTRAEAAQLIAALDDTREAAA